MSQLKMTEMFQWKKPAHTWDRVTKYQILGFNWTHVKNSWTRGIQHKAGQQVIKRQSSIKGLKPNQLGWPQVKHLIVNP